MNLLPALAVVLLPATMEGAPDFDTEVLPVLTRAGCNSGACHGAAVGRGGLRLSLWGSDPAADHDSLVREFEGRRVNLASPEKSLLLRKPTNELKHGGGRKLDPEGEGAKRLRSWIATGAGRGAKRKQERLVVMPGTTLVVTEGERVALRTKAEFDDGSREDVTAWTVFTADDPGSVDLDARGFVQITRPGQHTVVARFLDRVVAIRLILPFRGEKVDLSLIERRNYIDEEVLSTLSSLRMTPAAICDDATFLRRLRLDLTGTLPSPEEVRSFLADGSADKRDRLVERLLASSDFVDFWTLKWSRWLRISSRSLGSEGAARFHGWVREQMAAQVPLDGTARELLTSLGDTRRVLAANFVRVSADAREQAEQVGRLFLGVRIQCANCHNHPLDRWTQDDYHGLAAVFARLERGPVVRLVSHGEVIHPRTGEAALARLPGERFLKEKPDAREELARWVTSKDNPYFARALVNRLWREMMGRGLVEPVDDMRETSPATHPQLLDRLADDLIRHDFDMRHLLRRIATSAAYQRGPRGALSNDDRFYSHALVKPLGPEVLADAIADVTGVANRHGDLPLGTRAITLSDPLIPSPALDILGRCGRMAACEEETSRGGLARTLALINGPLLNAKMGHKDGRLQRMIAERRSTESMVEEFYLRALGRGPSEKEARLWRGKLGVEDRDAALEDFVWALLTSKDFGSNR